MSSIQDHYHGWGWFHDFRCPGKFWLWNWTVFRVPCVVLWSCIPMLRDSVSFATMFQGIHFDDLWSIESFLHLLLVASSSVTSPFPLSPSRVVCSISVNRNTYNVMMTYITLCCDRWIVFVSDYLDIRGRYATCYSYLTKRFYSVW